MGKINSHRHGSMAVRPRKRAAELTPRIKCWPDVSEIAPLGFAAFKAGMTSAIMVDDSNSPSKGFEASVACTVVETPALLVYGVRGYVYENGCRKVFSDAYSPDEKLLKSIFRSPNANISKLDSSIEKLSDITLLAATQPGKTGIGKKVPDYLEIALGGTDAKLKLAFAKNILGKELNARDVFKDGELVDVIAVTIGKGLQGAVKRFGIHTQRRKATGKVRHVGTLGPWHPSKVMYTVPMAGQMGFHRRTQFNVRILKLGEKPQEINPAGGFKAFGTVRNPYIILKGSVQGPSKRFVVLRKAMRVREIKKPEIKSVSLSSKQGN